MSTSTDNNSGRGEPLERDHRDEAYPDVPMLREPRLLPGRPLHRFSPQAFYALSREERTDVDVEDEGLWLTEEAAPKITSSGIVFHKMTFWSPDLYPYVNTGSADKRRFVIRYDRALLARGVLDELVLLECMPDGSYVPRCRCGLKDESIRLVDTSTILRQLDHYTRVLRAKRSDAEARVLEIGHGQSAVEALHRQQAARVRRQRAERKAPLPARPMRSRSSEASDPESAASRAERFALHLGDESRGVAATVDAHSEEATPEPAGVAAGPAARPASAVRGAGRPQTGSRRKVRSAGRSKVGPESHPSGTDVKGHALGEAAVPTAIPRLESDLPTSPIESLADHLGGNLGITFDTDD